MKRNLLKMRVCIGFDCNPRLEVISYEDEVDEHGRTYQSLKGVRNEKTMVDLNGVWVRFDNTVRTPFWDAYAIVDATESDDEIELVGKKLYSEAMKYMKDAKDNFALRIDGITVPGNIAEQIREKINPPEKEKNGIIRMTVDKFKEEVYNAALSSGTELAVSRNIDAGKWNDFFRNTMTYELLGILMKGLPVLKISGGTIEFQNDSLRQNAIGAVSGKVMNDVFARFVESNRL